MGKVLKTSWLVLKALLSHKATYRLLAILLVTFGVSQGGTIATAVGDFVCAFMEGCVE